MKAGRCWRRPATDPFVAEPIVPAEELQQNPRVTSRERLTLPNAENGSAPELSVVLPCLNEAETLSECIAQIRQALEATGAASEVLVADNGSSDGSVEIAAGAGARVIHVAERGYGAALAAGIAAARGRYVLMGDADGSYDFSHIPRYLGKLREGYDFVIGNRFRGGIAPGAMPPLHRYLGTPVLTRLNRLFFSSPCGDVNCGLRAFSRDAVTRLGLRTTGMEFATEMIVKASLFGMRIAEVPTSLAPDRRSRPPHLRTWRDGWRHLRFMLLFSPRWLFLYPGLLLMLLGLGVGAWLLPGPRSLGAVTLDVHTLLYAAAAVMIGFEFITFAVFTKIFAITEGLLPPDPRLDRLLRVVKLETGLAIGAILLLLGIGGTAAAVLDWGQVGFRELRPTETLRVVIPAVLSLVLGLQVILSSFFLSVLGLRRR
jgi:glycosyltransferase involved in cell wall biosynthesis